MTTETTQTSVTLEVPQEAAFRAEQQSEHPCVSAEFAAERTARLLVAGTFPDKGLRVKPEDLDALVARFSPGTVPVKVEHVDSPLDPLGLVQRVWRDGAALMGTLAFPADLSGFLQRRGIARLSVGLTRDPLQLAEVSLVLKPRIASAALLSGDPTRLASQGPSPTGKESGSQSPLSGKVPVSGDHAVPIPLLSGEGWPRDEAGVGLTPEAEMLRLRRELLQAKVEGQIAQWRAQGRVVPACEPAARALLALDDEVGPVVTLSEGAPPLSVAAVFRRFLETLPPRVVFAETAPSGDNGPEGLHGRAGALTPDQEEFLRRVLGVDPARVQELMADGGKEAAHAR